MTAVRRTLWLLHRCTMRGEAARLTDQAVTVTHDTESDAELPGNSVSMEMLSIPPETHSESSLQPL